MSAQPSVSVLAAIDTAIAALTVSQIEQHFSDGTVRSGDAVPLLDRSIGHDLVRIEKTLGAAGSLLSASAASIDEALLAMQEARGMITAAIANIRSAPLFVQAAAASTVGGQVGKHMTQVPIEPTKLVDQPKPSANPALAKANDDQAGVDRAGFEQAVCAYTGKYPILDHRPLSEIPVEDAGFFDPAKAKEAAARAAEERRAFASKRITGEAGTRFRFKIKDNDTPSSAPLSVTDTAPRSEEVLPAARESSRSGPVEGSEKRAASAAGRTLQTSLDPVEPVKAAEPVPVESDQLDRAAAKASAARLAVIRESAVKLEAAKPAPRPRRKAIIRASEKRAERALPVRPASFPAQPFELRRARFTAAESFLKQRGILVTVVDRETQIRTYRITGRKGTWLLDDVVAMAQDMGMPLDG